jgi:hypothetical protein
MKALFYGPASMIVRYGFMGAIFVTLTKHRVPVIRTPARAKTVSCQPLAKAMSGAKAPDSIMTSQIVPP